MPRLTLLRSGIVQMAIPTRKGARTNSPNIPIGPNANRPPIRNVIRINPRTGYCRHNG